MTYRIIEGELYTVIESNSCFARMVPCVFAKLDNSNHPCACMRFIGDSQYPPPCAVPGQPPCVFFTDEAFLKYLSKRLTS